MRAALLALVLLPMLVRAQVPERLVPDPPEHVTSDTKDYCFALAQQMDTRGAMPADARDLWRNGRLLCERGQVQSGLLRLRHAMLIIHMEDGR